MLNIVDILILIILALFTAVGTKRGLISEGISLISWTIAFGITDKFYNTLAHELTFIRGVDTRIFLAITILFVGVLFTGFSAKLLLNKFIKFIKLGFLNRILGGVVGLLKGSIIIFIFLSIISGYSELTDTHLWQTSYLIPHILAFTNYMNNYI